MRSLLIVAALLWFLVGSGILVVHCDVGPSAQSADRSQLEANR